MTLLHTFCGDDYEGVRDDLLAGLAAAQHESDSRVFCAVGRKAT